MGQQERGCSCTRQHEQERAHLIMSNTSGHQEDSKPELPGAVKRQHPGEGENNQGHQAKPRVAATWAAPVGRVMMAATPSSSSTAPHTAPSHSSYQERPDPWDDMLPLVRRSVKQTLCPVLYPDQDKNSALPKKVPDCPAVTFRCHQLSSSGHPWSPGQTDLTKALHPGNCRLKSGFGGLREHRMDPTGMEMP